MLFSRRTLVNVTLLVALLSCTALSPSYAAIYTTTLTADQPPGVYTGTPALGGLFAACLNTNNPDASPDNREALTVLTPSLFETVIDAIPSGQFYMGGYYDAATDGWYWSGTSEGRSAVQFASGATATPVNNIVAANWSTGYPKMAAGTSTIGALKYVAYDASLKGWINVEGTATLNGVACQSVTLVTDGDGKKTFPWWAILIIVLGCVVVIALVIVVVLCCCCRKKKRYTDDDDNDGNESAFTSRSGSFSSRGTSRTGSSYSGTSASSSSFSSRGSSKSSGTGSSSTGSSALSSRASSFTGSSRSSGTGTSSTGSSALSSRASSFTGSSRSSPASSTYSGTSSANSSSVASSVDSRSSARSPSR